MKWFETAFGAHYPLLYAHRDAGEADRAVAALERLAPLGGGPVLDLGCGAGRHLAPVSARGVTPLGLDLSAPLLARAALAQSPRPWLVRGDMRRVPLRDGAVTAVLSLFTAFGYFGPLAAHSSVVSEVARVMRPGAHWFLDYLNCDALSSDIKDDTEPETWRAVGPLLVAEHRRVEAGRVSKTVVLRPAAGREADAAALGIPAQGLRYTEEVALFSVRQLDELCAEHGLRRVAQAGGYDGEPFGPDAPRWLLAYARQAGTEGKS